MKDHKRFLVVKYVKHEDLKWLVHLLTRNINTRDLNCCILLTRSMDFKSEIKIILLLYYYYNIQLCCIFCLNAILRKNLFQTLLSQNNNIEEMKQFKLDDRALSETSQLKKETRAKLHKCQECDKVFKKFYLLKLHTRTHTGEKPYRCVQCNKTFSKPSALKQHSRLHTDDYPYRCSHCNKGFSAPSSLTVHERIHTGERTCVCKQCGKAFYDNGRLKAHTWTHLIEHANKECSEVSNIKETTDSEPQVNL